MRKRFSSWWKDTRAIFMRRGSDASENGPRPWQPNKSVHSERSPCEGIHSTVKKKKHNPVWLAPTAPPNVIKIPKRSQPPSGTQWRRGRCSTTFNGSHFLPHQSSLHWLFSIMFQLIKLPYLTPTGFFIPVHRSLSPKQLVSIFTSLIAGTQWDNDSPLEPQKGDG